MAFPAGDFNVNISAMYLQFSPPAKSFDIIYKSALMGLGKVNIDFVLRFFYHI